MKTLLHRGLMSASFTFLLLFSLSAGAACTGDDVLGDWYAKYRYARPYQQVGECLFTIDPVTGVDGSCYNWTYDLSFAFFDAQWSLKKNCKFKAVADLDDGQRLILNGKLNPKTGKVSGTVTAITNSLRLKGTFKMQRY